MENRKRSFTKAISWRILASITTVILVFLFTKNLTISLGIGAVELVVKMMLYYVHERAWNKIGWGKE